MAKLNITRLPGESDEDFKRRYGREQMRAYRAAHPRPKKIRGPDLKPRKNSPFSQEEWDSLRRQPEETEAEWRARNQAARDRVFDEKHPGVRASRASAYAAANPEKERARGERYRKENPGKLKAMQKRYYEENKEARIKNARDWVERNPERKRERQREWYAANPGMNAFYSSKWRKAAIQATPLWADLGAIRAVYQECARISEETGIPHHVDHFYPLRGKTVSGLHVVENLRIIPASENVRKHSKHPEEHQ